MENYRDIMKIQLQDAAGVHVSIVVSLEMWKHYMMISTESVKAHKWLQESKTDF